MDGIIAHKFNYKQKWNDLKSLICDKMIESIKENNHLLSKILSEIL